MLIRSIDCYEQRTVYISCLAALSNRTAHLWVEDVSMYRPRHACLQRMPIQPANHSIWSPECSPHCTANTFPDWWTTEGVAQIGWQSTTLFAGWHSQKDTSKLKAACISEGLCTLWNMRCISLAASTVKLLQSDETARMKKKKKNRIDMGTGTSAKILSWPQWCQRHVAS